MIAVGRARLPPPIYALTIVTVMALLAQLHDLVHDGSRPQALTTAGVTLESLRSTPWNVEAERQLENHPYVRAAESGALTVAQRRAFVLEQFRIQRSDAASFASLAGHPAFNPATLMGAVVPPCAKCATNASSSLFQYLAEGEVHAFSLLIGQARALGLDENALAAHIPSERAQEYPRLWAELARTGARAAGAAAVAVNFPAWGRMCGRVRAALTGGLYGPMTERELGFLAYFSEPIDNLDEMATAVLEQESGTWSDDGSIAGAVRKQQEAELAFWGAIYEAR